MSVQIILLFTLITNSLQKIDFHSIKTIFNDSEDFNLPANKCFSVKLKHLFQSIEIDITEIENIDKIIITDYAIESDDLICNKNSTICFEHIFPKKIFVDINQCIIGSYIYGCTNHNQGKINIRTKLEKKNGCLNTLSQEDPSTECARNLNTCIDIEQCSTKCELLTCGDVKICTPRTDKESDRRKICNSIFPDEDYTMSNISCLSKIEEDKRDSNKFFKFLALVVGLIIVAVLISSLYYRFKLKQDGIEPFTPPEIMPGFLFPRIKKVDALL